MSTSPPAADAGAPARAVVITGAASGIGRATALDLGRRGFQVFAGVRKAADGELRDVGVAVSVIEPGAIATSIWASGNAAADAMLERMPPQAMEIYGEAMQRTRSAAEQRARGAISPDAVAAVVAQALTADRPKTRYVVGRTARAMALLSRFLPDRAFDAIVARAMS